MIHPLLVHLPIGIIALATVFEWLGRKEGYTLLKPALPLVWRWGAISAILSCISGWWMRQGGSYTGNTIDFHQWIGIGTAILTIVICFLKTRLLAGFIAMSSIIVTTYQGGSLTHGNNYLWSNPSEAAQISTGGGSVVYGHAFMPDTIIENAEADKIRQAQQAGLTIVALDPKLPWLSVSFFNLAAPPDSLFELLENLAPQITYLHFSGVTMPEKAWPVIGRMVHLTKLNGSGSNIADGQIQYLVHKPYLHYLNLTQTNISIAALNDLKKIPRLRQLFLYQTLIKLEEWPLLFQNLPQTTIDTGNYQVPTFSTDTTVVSDE